VHLNNSEPMPFEPNLFRNLFHDVPFEDRFTANFGKPDAGESIDVIIPLLHSTDLWRENLLSYFREIPIARLLVGDGGVIDNSLEILKDFPRVEVIDHRNFLSLGKSISDLISRVKTDHFVYLQSDVFLPSNWFDDMWSGTEDFEWFGCPMHITMMMDYPVDYSGSRPLVGSQIGLTRAFNGINNFIEDDFVYRNEEFVFDSYVKHGGFRTGAVKDTFHFHQVSRRRTNGDKLDITGIEIQRKFDPNEVNRVLETQTYGLIKYCKPDSPETIAALTSALDFLITTRGVSRQEIVDFAETNGSEWKEFILKAFSLRSKLKAKFRKVANQVISRFT
jgi:hypothetical protein